MFKKNELGLLWPFYLEYFIASVLFFAPAFWTVYFINLGFSLFQIGSIMAVSQLAKLIFEIPTGAFADLYGRKASTLLGYFLEGICMLSLFFFNSFYGIMIIFALWGFGCTFSSGSKDAWIVDSLNKKNKGIIHSFFAKQQFFIHFGLFLSGIMGAFIVRQTGLDIIWLVAAISYLVSIILLAFFTTEDYELGKRKTIVQSFTGLKKQSKTALGYSYKHPVLFYFLAAGITFIFAVGLQESISWIPLLMGLGMKDYAFGYLWSVMALVVAVSPLLGHVLMRKGKERNYIILALLITAIILPLVLIAYNLIFAILILLLVSLFITSKSPAEEVYFHRFVPLKLRATVGSIRNMMTSLASILALPLAGLLVDNIGSRYTIVISAVLLIPAILIYLKIKEKK